jgi:putative transposase
VRTTNIVESPFAAVRLRTTAAKRFKRVEDACALIWKLICVAEKTFRKLNAPQLLKDVAAGTNYVNGIPVPSHRAAG